MNKSTLFMIGALARGGCDMLGSGDKDDLIPPCNENKEVIHEACSRTDNHTVQTKIRVIETFNGCKDASRIGVTISAPGGVTSYKLRGPNGQILEDEDPNETAVMNVNDVLGGGIHTDEVCDIATVKIRQETSQGRKVIHEYTTKDCK